MKPKLLQKFVGTVQMVGDKTFLAIMVDKTDPSFPPEEWEIWIDTIAPKQKKLLKYKGKFDFFIYDQGYRRFRFYTPRKRI
jgi:hypothetical protein